MRTDRLLVLADHFESAAEENCDMEYWWIAKSPAPAQMRAGDMLSACGTSCCIGGATISLFAPDKVLDRGSQGWAIVLFYYGNTTGDFAAELLELSSDEKNLLLNHHRWSGEWRRKYNDGHAKIMAEVCRTAAQTGNLDFLRGESLDD